MREIKFRAWDKKEKCWTYSDHLEGLTWFFGMIEGPLFPKGYILHQYTNLKDKDGKEIYSGDIVKFVLPSSFKDTHDDTHVVGFPEDFLWLQTQGKEIKVIGNRFENPELLKLEGK